MTYKMLFSDIPKTYRSRMSGKMDPELRRLCEAEVLTKGLTSWAWQRLRKYSLVYNRFWKAKETRAQCSLDWDALQEQRSALSTKRNPTSLLLPAQQGTFRPADNYVDCSETLRLWHLWHPKSWFLDTHLATAVKVKKHKQGQKSPLL